MRSASRPGSSMLVAMTMTSGEMGLPRLADFSRAAFTLRIKASSSRPFPTGSGSGIDSMRACRKGWPSSKDLMRARPTPCTSTRMRPSGSFSMRMIRATVPTVNMSSGPGSSSSCRFWAVSRIMRLSARAASTALIDRSRLTYSGTIMKGKMTMSRRGRTGRTSGTFGVSSFVVTAGAVVGSSVIGVLAPP